MKQCQQTSLGPSNLDANHCGNDATGVSFTCPTFFLDKISMQKPNQNKNPGRESSDSRFQGKLYECRMETEFPKWNHSFLLADSYSTEHSGFRRHKP